MFKKPPLPFLGNKGRFCTDIQLILHEQKNKDEILRDTIFIDLFGGSLYISHLIKRMFPNNRVIANDYDNYCERLEHINETNELLQKIKDAWGRKNHIQKVTPEMEEQAKEILRSWEGYFDYITLCNSLLYSGYIVSSKEELLTKPFWNRTLKKDYSAEGYLDGLEIVREDWEDLYKRYENTPYVYWIVDPPFPGTYLGHYKGVWRLKDALKTMCVAKTRIQSFMYFSGVIVDMRDVFEYLSENDIIDAKYEIVELKRGAINKNNCQPPEIILYSV